MHETFAPLLRTVYRAQLDPGDENCENFEFVAPLHRTLFGTLCTWNPQQIIKFNELSADQWWTCPDCKTTFEAYIPVDSEMKPEVSN